MKMQTTEPKEEMRVSTLESFFDLVFVFTITQLTYLVAGAHGPLDFLLVLLVLMLIWWMYDAYAWLTNEAGAGRPMRLVLIAAMAGFLVMALALPRSFGTDGLTFGLAYLFVIVLHLVAFLIKGGRSEAGDARCRSLQSGRSRSRDRGWAHACGVELALLPRRRDPVRHRDDLAS